MAGANLGMFFSITVLNFLSGFPGGGVKNVLLVCTAGMAACSVAAFFACRTKGGARAAEANV
jgi:hypothetical protein